MSDTTIKVSKSDKGIRAILKATYPDWKGRKIRIQTATSYQLRNYWCEGSRDYALAYDLKTGQAAAPTPNAGNPFRPEAHAEVAIPEGILIVEHSIFCGKDVGITIYVNPANLAPLLPAPAAS